MRLIGPLRGPLSQFETNPGLANIHTHVYGYVRKWEEKKKGLFLTYII